MRNIDESAQVMFGEAMRSKQSTTCSRWAENRRIMGAPLPGPYGFRLHPWCREIQNSTSAMTVAMKAAQLGVTECGVNRALYTLDVLKRNVLYVLPTTLSSGDFSKARFDGALSLSPYLKAMFTDNNAVALKRTAVNSLYIRGSKGESNLLSVPVSCLILDEVDRMSQKAIWLALERLSGQIEKHVLAISTPTVPNFGISKLFQSSSQDHFFFKCPCCCKMTELVWPDCVEIIGDSVSDPRCKESFLKCKECGGRLEHAAKPDFLKNGKWTATAPNADPAECHGYYVNQLYSSTVSPGELVIAYHRGMGDEAAQVEFSNSKLGLPHVGTGAQVTDAMIDGCLKNYTTTDNRPTDSKRCITIGVDQGKWNYVSVVEWFLDQYSNDVHEASLAKLLHFEKFLDEDFKRLDELMREWQARYCVIDMDPAVMEARRFARRYHGYVSLCRYRRGQTAKEIAESEQDTGSPVDTVDRTSWLSCALSRFKCVPPRIELPRDLNSEYREHLKALVRTYEKDDSGNPTATFISTGPDHYAHSLVYASIGLTHVAAMTSGQSIKSFM